MGKNKIFSVLLLLTFLSVIAFSGCSQSDEISGSDAINTKGPVIIQVIDAGGVTHDVDIANLTVVKGLGGIKKSTGTIIGPAEIAGPKLLDVLDQAGGLGKGQALELTANDGYKMTLTYDQVCGQVLTYDQEGEPLKTGGVDCILALESADAELLDIAPRVAFIGEGISDGHFWVKDVGQIKVTTAPEE